MRDRRRHREKCGATAPNRGSELTACLGRQDIRPVYGVARVVALSRRNIQKEGRAYSKSYRRLAKRPGPLPPLVRSLAEFTHMEF